MLSKEVIRQLAVKRQTSEENIAREYAQSIFLSILYQLKNASKLLFKGGTALKLAYKSPRYSEDLDFTGVNISVTEIEDLLHDAFLGMERQEFKVHLEEATTTTGGYLGRIFAEFLVYRILIKLEISLREKKHLDSDAVVIESDFLPNYIVYLLPEQRLVEEKINCVLSRGKPRDYFDAYFLLRNNLIKAKDKGRLKAVLEKLDDLKIDFKRELGKFLPKSSQPVIKSLSRVLAQEIHRHI